jgi:hypothetical protein
MQTRTNGKARTGAGVPIGSPDVQAEGRYVFAGTSVALIWIAAAMASIWSPDMITGSEHEHLAIAAFVDWFYAAIATGLVLMAFGRRTLGGSRQLWTGFTVAVGSIWIVVALASIFAPSMVTGSDPTTIPIAAFAAPLAGVIATAFASVFVAGSPGR